MSRPDEQMRMIREALARDAHGRSHEVDALADIEEHISRAERALLEIRDLPRGTHLCIEAVNIASQALGHGPT